MPFDVQGSRDAGYSDDEIVSYLTKTSNFDLKSAQDVGYSNDEIINHLSGYDGPQPGPVIPGESISTTAGIPREEPTEPGFFETVGEDIGERAETIAGLVKRRAPSGEKSKFGAVAEIAAELPTTTALAAGQVAGGVLDVAGETIATGVKTIAKAITPDPVEEKIKAGVINVLETKAGQLGLRAMQKGAGAYRKFKEKNPDAALSLELIVNVTGLGIGKKATARTGKEIMDIGRDISAASTKAIPARIDRKIAKEVSHGINKGIRPTVVGKGTFSQTQQYYKKATNAVESIIENKANLQLVDKFGDTVSKLPESLKDFSMAIEQTKRNIFTQYDDLAKQAGAEFIDLQSVADDVFKISNNKSMQDFAPDVAKYADDLAQRLAKRGRYTTSEAQDAIATLNKSLESFYRNPSYDTAARASVDAGLVKLLRKKTDDVISTATGKQYQQLKSQYGALKTIEKEINHRMIVDFRKNTKGLVDLSDIFTGSHAALGLLKKDPAILSSAVVAKGIANYTKKINNPNFIIRKMFKNVDDLVTKRQTVGDAFAPMSSTIKAVDQAYGKVKKAITAKQRTAVREIINDIEPQIDLDVPAFIRRKGKIDLVDFEPKSTFGSGEMSPKVFEDVIRIAQSPEGKRLLIERLSAEEKYSKLVAAVIDIPTTK